MNLSNKILWHNADPEKKYGLFHALDVREAVRELKKQILSEQKGSIFYEVSWTEWETPELEKMIDEIFGEKLI